MDSGETCTREEGEVMDPEKDLTSPLETEVVPLLESISFHLALAGMALLPLLFVERPVLITRLVFGRAVRDKNGEVNISREQND